MHSSSSSPQKISDIVHNEVVSERSLAEQLRGFGPLGIITLLLILIGGNYVTASGVVIPVGTALVILWVHLSHTSWAEIGYVWPASWVQTAVIGIVGGILFKLLMKIVVMPLLGADPINHAYHGWVGNTAALRVALWACLIAGFGEETVSRGYLFERLGKLLGKGRSAKIAIVLVTSVMFGLSHFKVQGLAGAEQAAIVGLVFGAFLARAGRLVPLMIAHAAFDLTALAIIYWNLEYRVAHLVFR
jgi:membrane protease YdiL (CAAX protease family)